MRIANAYYLIVDLEATCTDSGAFPREEMEIIEIGAVLQSSTTFEVESEFQTFVRPVRHPGLTEFCTHLTGIKQEEVAGAPEFPAALGAMRQWMSAHEDARFCSWGNYDRNQFCQDCRFHRVPYPFRGEHLNLKEAFSETFGHRRKSGIGDALRQLGLKFEGSPHRGLDDARNIARIVQRAGVGA